MVARQVADEGIVLLKNENGMLPLDASKLTSLAVIGENATRLQAHGGQSSEIKAFYEITPLAGLLHQAGAHVNVTYSSGYSRDDDSPQMIEHAVEAARAADVAVVVGGLNHDSGLDCEGTDRADLKLPYHQNELIQRVVEANPRTIVVLIGTIVEMDPWLNKVPAVLQAWYPGMEGGNAIARVLFGEVNPSGKLPCTFPKRLEDSPAHALKAYPGANGVVRYEEGLLVGYRWFDTKVVEPLFPFGYGLSYTRFQYSDLRLKPAGNGVVTAEFTVTNVGARDGAEVAQLYVQEIKPRLQRPLKELKGFSKVILKAGEKKTVTIPLDERSFAFYDPEKKSWIAEAGDFKILVGGSSRDIELQQDYRLAKSINIK
jgi:beta-glucosidase